MFQTSPKKIIYELSNSKTGHICYDSVIYGLIAGVPSPVMTAWGDNLSDH